MREVRPQEKPSSALNERVYQYDLLLFYITIHILEAKTAMLQRDSGTAYSSIQRKKRRVF